MASKKVGTKAKAGDLTVAKSLAEFQRAYRSKSKLIERQKEDFLYALGDQWSADDKAKLETAKIKPVTDNRIAPNLYLLTGLERQNRADFQAFPVGEEDGTKAEIASALFKDAIVKSGFGYKSSEQFKDGITCGESHLELYLDYTESILNAKPVWQKCDGNTIFPDPLCREYDFADARYVYKLRLDIAAEDLINLYPEMQKKIEEAQSGKLEMSTLLGGTTHLQKRDYATRSNGRTDSVDPDDGTLKDKSFDLIERYYKKWVPKFFVGDKKTGEIKEAESKEKATAFIDEYTAGIQRDQQAYEDAVHQRVVAAHAQMNASLQPTSLAPALAAPSGPAAAAPAGEESGEQFGQPTAADEQTEPGEGAPAPQPEPARAPQPIPLTPDVHAQIRDGLEQNKQLPPAPPPQDPERFIVIKRQVPEIWCFAQVPGIDEPLCDEPAWFYPNWKQYPFIPYYARFSTAPLHGDERHLLVQGIVHGVKGVQEKHNKAEMLMLRHLNGATNSGWLAEEDSWVNPAEVKMFGTQPGVNLEYKQGREKPERIVPGQLSQGHAEISAASAEAIIAQLGINADLLAVQQSGTDSGRAIALRQKQGLLMVQELFDNLTRTRIIAGRLLLSQLGELYDTESASKVLGEAYLKKTFPPLMLQDPANPQNPPKAMPDPETGAPMEYDKQMAELAIAEVLKGTLGDYDVTVGESVSSETQKMAAAGEMKEIAQTYPGLVPPDMLVRYSQLPESAKAELVSSMEQAQAAAAQAAAAGGGAPPHRHPPVKR